jgi:hypothetical protein
MLDLEAGVHDEYQDVDKDLYWFGPPEHNTLRLMGVFVSFTGLG